VLRARIELATHGSSGHVPSDSRNRAGAHARRGMVTTNDKWLKRKDGQQASLSLAVMIRGTGDGIDADLRQDARATRVAGRNPRSFEKVAAIELAGRAARQEVAARRERRDDLITKQVRHSWRSSRTPGHRSCARVLSIEFPRPGHTTLARHPEFLSSGRPESRGQSCCCRC
jgi:putative NIF3 family GTP cyclohydrolase 1 type 2